MSRTDDHDALGEQLSALWSDELSAPEAEALRQRIAAEPEVAVRWARLCRALEALEALPDELTPPAPARAAPRRWAMPGVPWALLAASVGLWLWPAPAHELLLASGSQWVEGEVRLAAGDLLVDVDGTAWISVEPAGPVRVWGAEGEMNKATVLAGLVGAVVTVAVYEGTAVVRAASDAPVVVAAGETHRVAPAAGTPQAPLVAGASAAERLAEVSRLEQELDQAKQALAESEFSGALTRGQLQALQGSPSPWPADVPEVLAPEAFRAGLEAKLAEFDHVELALLDCDEYPCIAAIRRTDPPTDDGDWNREINDALGGWLKAEGPEQLSVNVNSSRFSEGDAVEDYVIIAAYGAERESDVGRRTEFRIDATVDELGARMR